MRRLEIMLVGLLLMWASMAHAGDRVALVIGNGSYTHTSNLAQAPADARAVGAALRDVGFEVTVVEDAGVNALRKALVAFYQRIEGAEISVVYYAGHGIQVGGTNYLVPVDAALQVPEQASYQAVSTPELLGEMGVRGADLNVVILDACRNNPFARNWSGASRGIEVQGLGAIEQVPANFVVAYATDPNAVAEDSGVYAEALVKNLTTVCTDLDTVFRRVQVDVLEATERGQRPWVEDSAGLLPRQTMLAGCPVADPLVSSDPAESIEVRFVPFRTARKELGRATPNSWGHIVSEEPVDGTRRFAAVRETRLLPPDDFAVLVGDPARARKVRNLSRASKGLFGIQLGFLIGGIVLATQESTQTIGTTFAVTSLGAGAAGLIVLHQRARTARYELPEAEAAVLDAGGTVLGPEAPAP